jgi:hypothetical protein
MMRNLSRKSLLWFSKFESLHYENQLLFETNILKIFFVL